MPTSDIVFDLVLRPHGAVSLDVFVDAFGLDARDETGALRRLSSSTMRTISVRGP
jgi:hypothetical protein